ncbi:MAG TPA: HNH endonuclease signature motif containing protein [Thermoplasmata archaeon]|nr:HNH endonuclease signature motif containing protein [Thermoplasmata archaeon]
MQWDQATLDWVYDKTGGYCRYCEKKLSRTNYARPGERGAWEVDHSVPISLGGTDYFSNLWPACIDCNRDKGTLTGSRCMRRFEGPRQAGSGDGIVATLAGVILLYLLYRVLSHPKSDG